MSFQKRTMTMILAFAAILTFGSSALAEVYTDKFTTWNPKGKFFDVLCFNKDNRLTVTLKEAEMIFLKKSTFKVKTQTGEQEIQDLNCIMEQKGPLPVARIEFTEAIYRVECDLAIQTIRRADFRLLHKNKTFTSIKRLSDGKVWILPTNSCKLTMVLPSLKPELPPQQEEVRVEAAKP